MEHRYLYTLFTKNQKTLLGHTDWVRSVVFSPDGKRIASGSRTKWSRCGTRPAARRSSP